MKELIHDVTDEDLEEQRKIREQIRERWDKLGFTEGVKKNIEFENLMELYESQARVLDKDFWKEYIKRIFIIKKMDK